MSSPGRWLNSGPREPALSPAVPVAFFIPTHMDGLGSAREMFQHQPSKQEGGEQEKSLSFGKALSVNFLGKFSSLFFFSHFCLFVFRAVVPLTSLSVSLASPGS